VSSLLLGVENTRCSVKCTSCDDSQLLVAQVQGVELDACKSCGGMFFDAQAVGALLHALELGRSKSGIKELIVIEGLGWAISGLI